MGTSYFVSITSKFVPFVIFLWYEMTHIYNYNNIIY